MVMSKRSGFIFHDDNTNYSDPRKDMPEERKFPISDDCEAIAYRDPVYGLWKIKYSIGPVPAYLSGSWNNIKDLERAITDYKLLRNSHVTRRESKAMQQRREHKEFLRSKKIQQVL